MGNCSRIESIPYSPLSPPLIDQGPSTSANYAQWSTEPEGEDAWMTNPHIAGLTKSANGICGQSNYTQHSDCTVCGTSFATIQKENTLGYMEETHVPEENIAKRIRRRNAFQVGMGAGSFVLVPGGVSQAAAFDGVFYQISAGNKAPNPSPGGIANLNYKVQQTSSFGKKGANCTTGDRKSTRLK